MKVDVLIIGGGPAGSAVALTLLRDQPDLKVMIVEKGNYEQQRVGESLPPAALDLLYPLGIAPSFLQQPHLPAYGTAAAWGSDEVYANEFIFQTNNRGWHLDRSRFDAFMADEAQKKGAILFRRSKVLNYKEEGTHYHLTLQNETEPIGVKTRFLVDASGRCGWWAKRQKVGRIKEDRLIGFCRFFQLPKQVAKDSYALVESWENGWWYSALLPNQKMVVAVMTDAELSGQYQLKEEVGWNQLLAKSQYTSKRLSEAIPTGQLEVWPAATQRLNRASGNRWLAVGDAAATLDPLSSQGIMHALQTGIFGAYAILDFFRGKSGSLEKYDRWMRETYQEYLETKASFYEEEQRWPDHPFWQKRQRILFQNT